MACGFGMGEYDGRVIFESLKLWMDPVKRLGPEAMAVDEWLLETAETPVLRVYDWCGEWGSLGYFGALAEARAAFPGVEWVRRWTGGGTVDHRADWTYTMVVPAGERLAGLRGAESYRAIHAALAEALRREGIAARLSAGAEETGASACFENPVSHDLIDGAGRKMAGAGQRRTKQGLLHQGSVALAGGRAVSTRRAENLAAVFASRWEICEIDPPQEIIAGKVRQRYGLDSWTLRR